MNIEQLKNIVANIENDISDESINAIIKSIILEHFGTDKFAIFFYAIENIDGKTNVSKSRILSKIGFHETVGLLEYEKNELINKLK